MFKKIKRQIDTLFHSLPLNNFQRSLLLFVVLPLVIFTAVGLRIGLQQANDFQQKRLKNDLELIGRAISIPVGDALNNNDLVAIDSALSSVFVLGEVYGASVFDINGHPIAIAGVTETDLSASTIPIEIKKTGEGQERFSRVEGRKLFSHFLPLFDRQNRIQGLIQITRKASDFERTLQRLTYWAWGLWALFSLSIFVIVLLGHYGGIGRYIGKLLGQMRKVGASGLHYRFSEQGPIEVKSLAQGLNEMLADLAAAQNRVEEHRLAELELEARLQEREKMAAIGSVAQGIAHELGAPLTVIDGRARRIQKQPEVTDTITQNAQAIRQQVERLTAIVQQLLQYSRQAQKHFENVNLAELIFKAVEIIQSELQLADCTIKLNVHSADAIVNADGNRLELACLNLLRNSLQAHSSHIEVSLIKSPQGYQLTFTDDGVGLPTHYEIADLLEPFLTTKEPGKGTGLGLAIVKAIAEEHQANFQIYNLDTQGCEAQLIFKEAV